MSQKTSTTRLAVMAIIAFLAGIAIGIGAEMYMQIGFPPNPKMTLATDSVQAGKSFTVQLSGFPANTEIYGWTTNENPPRTFTVGTTDSQGKLEITGNAPQTPGEWILIACDKDYQYWAFGTLTVT